MNYNPFSLAGKNILVTGASSGIGENISMECSKMGAHLFLTARNNNKLKQTLSSLEGSNHQSIVADLSQKVDIDTLSQNLPNLDGIVFCAGMLKTSPAKNILDATLNEVFQTNFFSSVQLVKRLLKLKKIKKEASIIFISSIATHQAKIGNSVYSASKGAINSFSKVLALELAPQKIRVNCVQPGFIPTSLLENGVITQDQIQQNIERYPLGAGKPSDVSFACIYLLSDASKWVTGSILTIDGGVTIK